MGFSYVETRELRAVVGVGLSLHPEGKKGRLVRTGYRHPVGADNVSKHLGGCATLSKYKKVPITRHNPTFIADNVYT